LLNLSLQFGCSDSELFCRNIDRNWESSFKSKSRKGTVRSGIKCWTGKILDLFMCFELGHWRN
jgi:hypothetical protein